MILISHRGNINGPNEVMENSPFYIMEALSMGFDVEIDIWYKDGDLWLGHDNPQYKTSEEWLKSRSDSLWIHCKNVESLCFFNSLSLNFNYFWHQQDTLTLTSKNQIWAYPGKQPIKNSISVMPEINNDDISTCIGICSDYILKYKLK